MGNSVETVDGCEQQASNEAENKRRASEMTSDLLPTCPRCGDLCPVGSTWCAECGCRLTVDAP